MCVHDIGLDFGDQFAKPANQLRVGAGGMEVVTGVGREASEMTGVSIEATHLHAVVFLEGRRVGPTQRGDGRRMSQRDQLS
jgi:hypothetical protein